MDIEAIHSWLRHRQRKLQLNYTLAGVFFVVLGMGLMFGIFWGTYWLSHMIFGRFFGPDLMTLIPTEVLHIALSISVMIALFLGNVLSSSQLLTEYTIKVDKKIMRFSVPGMWYRLRTRTLKDKLLNVIYVAPQLIFTGLRLIKQACRLKKLDIDNCSKVLVLLYRNQCTVSFDNILKKVEEINPNEVFNQLFDIGGIKLQRGTPEGLELMDNARRRIDFFLDQS